MLDLGSDWFALIESNTTGSGRQFCSAASARGLRPILLTTDPDRYPYLDQDGIDHQLCDTGDDAAVRAACERLADSAGLSGVSSSSEYFVSLAARTAAALGLPGADPEALIRCRHKDRQRAALAAAGVPIPRFRPADSPESARGAAGRIGLPVVLKPTTGTGSSGVKLCRTLAEVGEWAADLLAVTTNERGQPIPSVLLVEEYLDGPEFSVEAFDGQVVAVTRKHLGPPPYFVEIGHDVPAPVPGAQLAALGEVARRAVTALGVDWAASHTELRLTAAGPVVIEVNPRLAGGMIPTLLHLTYGVDLIDWIVARSCGRPLLRSAAMGGSAAIRFLIPQAEGTLESVSGLESASGAPGVHLAQVTARPGALIRRTHSFRDRAGYVITTGPDSTTAAARAEGALSRIRLHLDHAG